MIHLFNQRNRHHGSQTINPVFGLLVIAGVFAAIFGVVVLIQHFQQNNTKAATSEHSALPDSDKKRKLKNIDDAKWSDENTLCIDDEMYGFDHRIETFLFIGTDHSGSSGDTESNADGSTAAADTQTVQSGAPLANEVEETDIDLTEEEAISGYHGGMADFMLLMVIDHTDGKYGYLQIDRNSVTEVPMLDENGEIAGYPVEQICTAHWYGTNPTQSAENTVDTVCDFLGELDHIDGYYVLDMDSVKTLNSTMGGVEVTFHEDLTEADPAFRDGATVRLTDEQAEKLVRIRMAMKDDSNAARMNRQRIFMEGFFRQAINEVRSNPNFANTLWTTLQDVATTDMSGNDFSRIAETLRSDDGSGILKFDGKSQLGTLLGDGQEHEEFYPSTQSMVDTLTTLFTLQHIDEEDIYISEDYE